MAGTAFGLTRTSERFHVWRHPFGGDSWRVILAVTELQIWLLLNLAAWTVAVVLWRGAMNRALPIGTWGAVLALGAQLIGVSLLRLWSWPRASWAAAGVPILLVTLYAAEAMIFARWLEPAAERGGVVAYVLAFSILNAVGGDLFVKAGLQNYIGWTTWGTFLVGLAAHVVIVWIARGSAETVRA